MVYIGTTFLIIWFVGKVFHVSYIFCAWQPEGSGLTRLQWLRLLSGPQ